MPDRSEPLTPEPVCYGCIEAAQREERWKEIIADEMAETLLLYQAAGIEQEIRDSGRAGMDLLIERITQDRARLAALEAAGDRMDERLDWAQAPLATVLNAEIDPGIKDALASWRQARRQFSRNGPQGRRDA